MKWILLFLFPVLTFSQSNDTKSLTFYGHFGGAYNLPSSLLIHQNGYEDIKLRAIFSTEAFKMPVYWDFKLDYQFNKHIVGLRLTHHKLVLQNELPEIQSFEITHGFNMINIYYGQLIKHDIRLNVGTGITFLHPEGIVRGQWVSLDEGIQLIGGRYKTSFPNIELAAEKSFPIYKRLNLNLSLRWTGSYAKAKIQNGYIETYTSSIHFNLGLGFYIFKESN